MQRFFLAAVAAMSPSIASASILLDRSPAETGAPVLADNLDNRAGTQNFTERVSFGSEVFITAMDIYMKPDVATLGRSVTIRLYEDVAGSPGTKLTEFTETVSEIDLVGGSGVTERVRADFTTPLALDGGTTYWIGMSGTGSDPFSLAGIGAVASTPVDDLKMAHYTGEVFGFFSGTATGDMAFRLEGYVPEPGTCVALAGGLLLLGRRRRGR